MKEILKEGRMRKTLSIVALGLFLASAVSGQNWFKGSLDEASAKAKNENKLLLLDFFEVGG